MRDSSTPIFKDLHSQGSETVAVTPGAGQQLATFNISGLPINTGDKRNYVQNFYGHLSTVVDPDAAGSAVSHDKLWKGAASWRIASPLLGEPYPHRHTRGAVLGNIIQVLANGYQQTQPARAQIPASTDTDVTIDLFYELPFSFEVLKKPHETAQFAGFFDQGTMECLVAEAGIYDGDYAGAVHKGPTVVRASCEMLPSPDISIGVPFQFRDREIVGGGTTPSLKGLGQESNLIGTMEGCGLAMLLWLTDAAGIGLGGSDGVDAITSIEIPWRNQPQIRNLDPYFHAARKAFGVDARPTSGLGTTIVPDGAGWPFAMDATITGRPSANAGALFLPIIVPGRDFETSKAQRILGDHPINFGGTFTNAHRFLSWELLEYREDQIARLANALGVNAGSDLVTMTKKALGDQPGVDSGKLRYTRIMFS